MGPKCIETRHLCPFCNNVVIVACFAIVSLKSSVKIQSVCSISIISKQIKALPKTIETNQLTASLLVKHIPHDKKKEKDISEKQLFEYFMLFQEICTSWIFKILVLLFVENFLKFNYRRMTTARNFLAKSTHAPPNRRKGSVKVSKNPQQTRGQHLKPQKYTKK